MKYFHLFFLSILTKISFCQKVSPYLFETKEFKIEFPSKPIDTTQLVQSNSGLLELNFAIYEPTDTIDSNYLYLVMSTKYPESTINSSKTAILDSFFRASIDGAVSKVNGKLIKEYNISEDNYPGRIAEIDFQNGVAIIRLKAILRKSILYMIQTITDTKKYSNLAVSNFFESFKLK